MNGRERYLRALTFQGPDRPPLWVHVSPGAQRVHGGALEDLFARYPSDVLRSPFLSISSRGPFTFNDHPRGEPTTVDKVTYDDWGCGWWANTADHMGRTVEFPLADWAAFDNYHPPDPMVGEEGVGLMEEAVRRDDHQHFVFVDLGELVQRMWFLRGYDNVLVDLWEDRPEVYALRDMITDWNILRVERWLETGVVDGFLLRDDWGTQNQLMVHPEIWRKVFKPAYKRIAEAVHQGGSAYACFHSDGYIVDIIPDLIEAGWDEINPQVPLMDVKELAARYGGKVCFRPCPDTQGVLPYGSREEVHSHLKRMFEALGNFNGGYVTTCPVSADVPLENIAMMLETYNNLRHPT